jgi:hypothetical protein
VIEADVASGDVAVVIAPVIVLVDEVTFAPVAKPDVAEVTSDVLARVPDVSVLSVRLRVAYPQTSDAASMFDEVDEPPVIVLVEAYVLFQTSAASAPKAESVLVGEAQTCAAERLLSAVIDAEVASGDVAEVTSDVLERVPDVNVASVKLRVAYPQTCDADKLLRPETDAAVARPEVAEVTPAAVARFDKSETARVLVPREEIVALISSFKSLPTLPVVETLDIR